MARYIDADKLTNKMFPIGLVDNGNYTINAKAIKAAIDRTPTADVAPKSEVAREIFEEIENRVGIRHDILDVWDILAELKKKYTGESHD